MACNHINLKSSNVMTGMRLLISVQQSGNKKPFQFTSAQVVPQRNEVEAVFSKKLEV